MAETSGNRRAFMRHDDRLLLKLRRLDEAECERILERLGRWRLDYPFDAHAGTAAERRALGGALRRIRERDADLAACLAQLERRLDALSRRVDGAESDGDEAEPVAVNLSARGLRCRTREALDCGDTVEIGLVLLPDGEQVAVIGRVIRAELDGGSGERTVSLHFEHMTEHDHETLVRHVFKLERDTHALNRRAA